MIRTFVVINWVVGFIHARHYVLSSVRALTLSQRTSPSEAFVVAGMQRYTVVLAPTTVYSDLRSVSVAGRCPIQTSEFWFLRRH